MRIMILAAVPAALVLIRTRQKAEAATLLAGAAALAVAGMLLGAAQRLGLAVLLLTAAGTIAIAGAYSRLNRTKPGGRPRKTRTEA